MRRDVKCSDKIDVTIIIVSHNTSNMTVDCIRSVLKQTSAICYEIIVFDNASTDGSVEAIRANFPDVKLFASTQNFGFARANNLAVTHARGRRILLLNPDTIILDGAIDKLHEFADKNPESRIWGGRTVFADGTLNPQSCWGRMTLWSVFCVTTGLSRLKRSGLFNSEGYGGWKRDSIRAVDIVTGCFFLIDRNLWERLHGFDTTFFMYGEEADLCIRAQQVGAQPMITPAATIIHYGGVSEPNHVDKWVKLIAAKITLMKRHFSASSFFIGRMLYLMFPLTRFFAYRALGGILGNSDLKHDAQMWHQVWQNRRRWMHGWSRSATTGPQDGLGANLFDSGINVKR